MKKLLPFLLAAFLPLTAHAQRQSVTVDPNGLGAGTFNTAGISYYFMGPNTYDFNGSTILNAGVTVTATAVYQAVTQANSFVAGEPVAMNSSGVWVGASANSTLLAANAVGVVSSTGLSSSAFQVVTDGLCVVSGGSFTTGSIYYVPVAAGVVTSTAPSTAGQYVYPLATALSATVLSVSTSTPSIVISGGGLPGLGNNNVWTGTNTFNNTVSGTGITSLFASPPAIGGTLAAAGSFAALSSTGTTALGGAAGGISTPGMISIGNNTTVAGYALELHGSTPIVANGGSAIQVNTQLTAAAANTYNFENFTPTFNTSTYTGNTLNSINVGTPTVNTTGGGTVTGGYQINVAAPASGQAGALNIASGAVNLGSGTMTVGGNVTMGGTAVAGAYTAIAQNPSTGTTSYAALKAVNSATGFWFLQTSTLWSGTFLTGGPTGDQAAIYTDASVPIVIGTNSIAALTLDTSQNATFAGTISMPKTITAPGTTGAQTINKASGTVRFAAAAGSLVVTDSVVTANSIITGNLITNDATAVLGAIVPASGSFTIYMKTNPTGETGVCFRVTN